jgi:prevent-host-death family protein
MKVVTIHQAKTNLSKLIQEALSGEEIIISKGTEPLIKLVVIQKKKKRAFNLFKGKVKVSKDFDKELKDFDEYQK